MKQSSLFHAAAGLTPKKFVCAMQTPAEATHCSLISKNPLYQLKLEISNHEPKIDR